VAPFSRAGESEGKLRRRWKAISEAIEDVNVGSDDAGTRRQRSLDPVEDVCRESVDFQRLFNHVCTLSPNRCARPSDAQNSPNPNNTEHGIDSIDFEELG
jgi:hypothetical protein